MNSPKINVSYTRHLSLTYTDAKILSQMISRINKEAIKPILAKHNLEYKSFNPEPLTLSKDGLEELREKIFVLYHSNRHFWIKIQKCFFEKEKLSSGNRTKLNLTCFS